MMTQATGGYGVILADPPWSYGHSACEGAAAKEYSTMHVRDICNLPIGDLAADDSVLLEWCTWPQMQEGLQVMAAWGFNYVTGFPWIKATNVSHDLWGELTFTVPYGIGFWSRGCSEFVLIGKRGNPSPPKDGFIGLLSPNLHHSRKPDNIYHYAESLPGPYLELFARRRRAGWDVFGNQVNDSIALRETA